MIENQTTVCESNVIKRCIEGNNDSFRELYDMYKDRIFSTCVRIVGDYQDAEETLQDIFVKIFNNIRSFRGDSSFTTWIYKITANT